MAKKKPNFKMRVIQEPKKRRKPTEAELEQVTYEAGGLSPEQKRRSLDKIRRDAKAYAPQLAYETAYQKKVEDGTVTLEDIEEFGDYSHPLYQKFLKDHREKERKWTLEHKKQQTKKRALRKAAEAKARSRSK
tara:strand:+ start:685 stop:1083 length:399 start_codon:yes stop_codon:yes gene_type:complete